MNSNEIEEKIIELEKYIKYIQSVSLRILQIYQSCKACVSMKKNIIDRFDPYPKNNEWVKSYKEDKTINIIDGLPIGANIVQDIEHVPNIKLSWVRSVKQFAFRLNGVLFRGNIGKIYGKREKGEKIFKCRKIHCKNIHNGKCPYYHDPVMYEGSTDIQNFVNSSWLYTSELPNKKNMNLRHFGDARDLKVKVRHIRGNDQFDLYFSQVIHDVLTAVAINHLTAVGD